VPTDASAHYTLRVTFASGPLAGELTDFREVFVGR
jgi:hypothetical protein